MGKKRKKGKGKAGDEALFGEERAPADRAAALREAGAPPTTCSNKLQPAPTGTVCLTIAEHPAT